MIIMLLTYILLFIPLCMSIDYVGPFSKNCFSGNGATGHCSTSTCGTRCDAVFGTCPFVRDEFAFIMTGVDDAEQGAQCRSMCDFCNEQKLAGHSSIPRCDAALLNTENGQCFQVEGPISINDCVDNHRMDFMWSVTHVFGPLGLGDFTCDVRQGENCNVMKLHQPKLSIPPSPPPPTGFKTWIWNIFKDLFVVESRTNEIEAGLPDSSTNSIPHSISKRQLQSCTSASSTGMYNAPSSQRFYSHIPHVLGINRLIRLV